MSRSIRLTRRDSRTSSAAVRPYKMAVEASEEVDMTDAIFVAATAPSESEPTAYSYLGIASPFQLDEYPENAPSESSEGRFRVSSVDIFFRTPEDREDGWTAIVASVTSLIDYLNDLDNEGVPQAVTITGS